MGERQRIEGIIGLAQKYLGPVTPLTVFAYEDVDALVAEEDKALKRAPTSAESKETRRRYLENITPAEAVVGSIFVYAGKAWQGRTMASVAETLTHEYFHNVQYHLTGLESGKIGATWLSEGGAEYATYMVLSQVGMWDLGQVRESKIRQTRGLANPLSSIETRTGSEMEDYNARYTLGYLGVAYLASITSEAAVTRKYWEAQKGGAAWQTAFKSAFGMPVADFYARFEAYRKAQFPPFCATLGGPLENSLTAPLSIKFIRQYPAGAATYPSLPWTMAPNIGYTFRIGGTAFSELTVTEKGTALKRPPEHAGWTMFGENCLVLYMPPKAAPGSYSLAIELANGKRVQANFEHSVVSESDSANR